MGNFKRDKFGSKQKFGGDRGFKKDKNRSDRPAMHQAICSECGKKCELPFKPSGNRAVFCSECFGKKDSATNRQSEFKNNESISFGEKKTSAPNMESYKKDFELLNSKLDDILTMLAQVIMDANKTEEFEFEDEELEVLEIDDEPKISKSEAKTAKKETKTLKPKKVSESKKTPAKKKKA